jgi:tRNA(fMet)-specific endonuclease VapC
MDYLLDTNILLNLVRDSPLSRKIKTDYNLFDTSQRLFISVVVEGEMLSLALQNNWGKSKQNDLQNYLSAMITVDIRIKSIINRYAEIDAFSKGKLLSQPLIGSARTMGKNDLWIAATASVLNIPLMTTDNDFAHLDGTFLKLVKILP